MHFINSLSKYIDFVIIINFLRFVHCLLIISSNLLYRAQASTNALSNSWRYFHIYKMCELQKKCILLFYIVQFGVYLFIVVFYGPLIVLVSIVMSPLIVIFLLLSMLLAEVFLLDGRNEKFNRMSRERIL